MSGVQQALLMIGGGASQPPPVAGCIADPYYTCGPTNDPYWANVVLMLHMDSDFSDSSSYNRTPTTVGNAAISGTIFKWGAGAGIFDGSGDKVTFPNSVDFSFPGDFTIEFWVRATASGSNGVIFSLWDASLATAYWLRWNSSNQVGWTQAGLGGSEPLATGVLSIDTWYHIAVARTGSSLMMFTNGLMTGPYTTAATLGSASFTPTVGSGAFDFTGQIDDLRITKGIARYTGNFTIPAEAFPDVLEAVWDPADPRTVLLSHAEDAIDYSCYQTKTITPTGSASISTVERKFDLSSFLIPNAGSSTLNGIVVTDHQDFDFGTGDFTIELWAYRNANTYVGTIFYATLGGGEFSLKVGTDGLIDAIYRSSGGSQTSSDIGTFPLTTWQHVVVQRRGTNWETYLEGALIDSLAITGGASSTVNSTSDWYFGRTNASSATSWNGYIDEIRVTKGVARYTAAFDPLTLPFCESTTATEVTPIEGTEALVGSSATVRIGYVSGADGDKTAALSGVSTTARAYSPWAETTTLDRTVALTGRALTVSRGSLGIPPYPNLPSSTTTTILIENDAPTATMTFFINGTYTIVDNLDVVLQSGRWLAESTSYSAESISNKYQVVQVNVFVGLLSNITYPTLPYTMSSSFSVVLTYSVYSNLNFDFQVSISPTTTNPRYGEQYYYGTHRRSITLSPPAWNPNST